MDQAQLSKVECVNKLASKLVAFRSVSQHDVGDEIEGGTLAHMFSDLETSFRTFVVDLLPKLNTENLTEAEATKILLEIGEEFRHIHYHLHASRFYEYLWPKEP